MPAPSSPAAFVRATARATSAARSAGPNAAVAESGAADSRYVWGPRSGNASSNSVATRAASAARARSRAIAASEKSFPVARPVRRPSSTRTERTCRRSSTFCVISLFANRVNALRPPPIVASTARPPAIASTRSRSALASSLVTGDSHAHLPEPGGRGAVGHLGHLARLPLATVHDRPRPPRFGTANGVAGIPELGRDALVAGMAQHPHALP